MSSTAASTGRRGASPAKEAHPRAKTPTRRTGGRNGDGEDHRRWRKNIDRTPVVCSLFQDSGRFVRLGPRSPPTYEFRTVVLTFRSFHVSRRRSPSSREPRVHNHAQARARARALATNARSKRERTARRDRRHFRAIAARDGDVGPSSCGPARLRAFHDDEGTRARTAREGDVRDARCATTRDRRRSRGRRPRERRDGATMGEL